MPQGEPPPARLFHAAVSDPGARTLYIHGGGDENAFQGPFFTDLWKLDVDAATWSMVNAASATEGAVGRIKHGLSFRPSSESTAPAIYAFAGHDDGELGNRNDVIRLELGGSPSWSDALPGDTLKHPSTVACTFAADFTTMAPNTPERRSAFNFAPRADGQAFVVFAGDSDCGERMTFGGSIRWRRPGRRSSKRCWV